MCTKTHRIIVLVKEKKALWQGSDIVQQMHFSVHKNKLFLLFVWCSAVTEGLLAKKKKKKNTI